MKDAIYITSAEYVALTSVNKKKENFIEPKFIRQTKANDSGDYEMYWEINGDLYYTRQNLFGSIGRRFQEEAFDHEVAAFETDQESNYGL